MVTPNIITPHSPLPLLRLQISELQGEALKREKEVRAKGQQQQKEHLAEVESLQVCLGACPHMYVNMTAHKDTQCQLYSVESLCC